MTRRGVNKVILVGNLGQDPEVRFFPNGGSICNVTIATSESWKDKQTGEQKELTEWHRVVFNNRLAEIAGEYLKKGSKVYIEGSLRTRKWQNQQGQDQYTTEVRANEMQMLDSRRTPVAGQGVNQASPQQQQGGFNQAAPQQQGGFNQASPQQGGFQQQNQQVGFNQAAPQQQGGFVQNGQQKQFNPQEPSIDFDDDIPFFLEHKIGMLHLVM